MDHGGQFRPMPEEEGPMGGRDQWQDGGTNGKKEVPKGGRWDQCEEC